MLENKIKEDEMVSIGELSKLTGFPIEMIQKELFNDESKEEISLKELRSAMVNFIDATMLED